jgi:NDP-sugar pyrophosphorylase family protein
METIGTSERDNLIAGCLDLVTESVKIGASQTIKRGTVLGVVTLSGDYVIVDATAIDGSEVVEAIAAEAVTTGAGESATIVAYLMGEFAINALEVGSGVAADYKAAARNKGIFFKNTVSK